MNAKISSPILFSLTLIFLFLSACQKENLQPEESISPNDKPVLTTVSGNFASYNRPIYCTLGTMTFGGCTPDRRGSCLILFPPLELPDMDGDGFPGIAHVSSTGDLILDVFTHDGATPPVENENTFSINTDMFFEAEVIDELYLSAGATPPANYSIPQGDYPATYEAGKITAYLTLDNLPVELNIWIQDCANNTALSASMHNNALSYLMKPEFQNTYSDDLTILNGQLHEHLNQFMAENNIPDLDFSAINIAEQEMTTTALLDATALTSYEKQFVQNFADDLLAIDGNLNEIRSQVFTEIESYECAAIDDANIQNLDTVLSIISTARGSANYWIDFHEDNPSISVKAKKIIWVIIIDAFGFGLGTLGGGPVFGGFGAALLSAGAWFGPLSNL